MDWALRPNSPTLGKSSVTRLSYLNPAGRAERRGLSQLAWLSLLTVAMGLLPLGCLFPGPPDYDESPQTPPFLSLPDPPTTQILAVQSGDVVRTNVKLRSEDAGEWLFAALYLNYLIDDRSRRTGDSALVSPGTFSDTDRTISIDWTVPDRPTPGTCEQLSLVVTHVSNLDRDNQPKTSDDVSIVTWWVSINASEWTISECAIRVGEGS